VSNIGERIAATAIASDRAIAVTETMQKPLIIRCEGPFTLPMAKKVRGVFSAAIEKHDVIVADVSVTTDLDLTFVQLLISAKKTAESLGKTFLVNMPDGSVVSSKVKSAAIQPNQMPGSGSLK
jgi:anti-anti-sigma regulatory factor